MRELLIVLGSLTVVALLEGGYYVFQYLGDRRSVELRRRLKSLGTLAGVDAGPDLLRAERYSSIPGLDQLLRSLPFTESMEQLLVQADLPWTVAQLLVYSAVAGAGGATLSILLRAALVPTISLTALGAIAPSLGVMVVRSRRSEKLSEQLPDALDMMARSLRAGHALSVAFQTVASEMPEPINIEFGRAYEEQKLGMTLEHSVLEMTDRAPTNGDLRIFAVSVMIQKETGGNLAEILGNIAMTIRERYRFFGKLRALTAEGRASGAVLGVLPLGMGLFLSLANPHYAVRLVDNQMGQLILAYAILSWMLGLAWLYSMTKIDY